MIVWASDFGAIGDGQTDDTAAIVRSIDAAGQTGAEWRLPPGVYLVRGSELYEISNFRFEAGDGTLSIVNE